MKFFSTIILFLSFTLISEASAFAPEKKKKKKGDDKTQISLLDKSTRQKLERFLLDAEKAKVVEDYEVAIKNYQDVITLDPTNSNAHFQLSQIYFTQGKLNDAETEAVAAVKLDAENKWFMEMLTNVYMNEGKTKDAADAFKSLIEKFPNNPDYFLNLGFLQSKAGQFENAIKTYDQYEKNFGIDENVVMEKKNLYLHLNKFNDAVSEVQKLIDANQGEIAYMLMLADMYRANRMKEKAMEVYKKILAIEPDNASALLAAADFGMQSGNEQQSLESIKKIFANPKVDVDTKVKILYPFLQYWDLQKDKHADAFELAETLTTVHPDDAKGYAIKGDLYYLDNQNDKALEAYLKALTINKDVFQVWQQVMVLYNVKRDWTNLQKTSTDAMELFPNQAMVYLFKGAAEQQNKELEKAVKSFSRGEKMSADNEKLRAQFFANLGDVYHSMNKFAASDSAYDRSLKLDPENSYVLNNYSYYLSLRKTNLEKAKQMSAYSNKLEPNSSSFLDTYAWILFQLNDFSGAKEWQEKAMKAGGDKSGTIIEHYGDILYELGNKEEAVKYWKQAKDLGTDSPSIEKKISEGKYIE